MSFSKRAITIIFLLFFTLFAFKAIEIMVAKPLHDYDEAHRAEGARNMRLNNYYTSPLTGTPYSQVNEHSQPYALKENVQITPEVGRPPLVFNLMAQFSGWFGELEWAYRLPSFLLGILGFAALLFFIRQYEEKLSWLALAVAFLAFLTSYDWWHSSMMALLDTGVAAFTALAIFLLLLFVKRQQLCYLIAAGISLGLGILSKGPPAVLFLTPLPYLWLTGRVKIKQLLLLFIVAFITILPWFIPLSLEHGWDYFFAKYIGNYVASPQSTKIVREVAKQNAPFFWYLRWWFDTFRPGIFLFGAFLLLDLIKKRLSWVKISLLFYIAGGLGLFSYAKAKVWWYVLPVIPAICAYLYFAVKDYLEEDDQNILSLSLSIIVASLPLFLWQTNTITLAYGFIVTIIVFIILSCHSESEQSSHPEFTCPPALFLRGVVSGSTFLSLAISISLTIFYFRFPTIKPSNPAVKQIGQYYQTLPDQKCLWIEEDFPYESALFYSRAGRVGYLEEETQLSQNCQNYLIGKESHPDMEKIFAADNIKLYLMN